MSETTVLFPVTGDEEVLDWLAEFGLVPATCALRYPTLGELRAAARSTAPAEVREHRRDAHWYAYLLFGPVEEAPGRAPFYAGGGFELTAEVDGFDDGVVVTSVGFHGGGERIDAVAGAIAAAVGPVVTVPASTGEPTLHE
jgi:hypothetical protein